MNRRFATLLVAIAVPLLLPGIPIFVFLVAHLRSGWGFSTWVAVLVPNLVLLVLVGGLAGGIYFFLASRPRLPR
jgi:hypothetical protein